ncbi:MAG: helix-turn-helix domain-containing protein [Anaerolineae bacterium]|nr:helix-turn-helix domain-containing protein [Anaerolineae bacterium]
MSKPGSKYHPLFAYLRDHELDEVALTFNQIEKLIGERLPEGAKIERGWWGNRKAGGAHAKAWLNAGFKVKGLDLERRKVIFAKPNKLPANYKITRDGDTVLWDAELIKNLRVHLSMTQAEFAEHLGVRQQTVSEWEKSIYTPTRASSKHLSLVAEHADFTYGEG